MDRTYSVYPDPDGCIFTESWCTDQEKHSIKYGVENVSAKGAYMEIGCFEGRSTVFTANLIHPKKLIAIDPWLPIDEAPYEVAVYRERPIEEHFKHNIATGTKGNVVIHKMKWEEFFESWTKPIAYLYLDGPHTYENVYSSLEIITPLVASGGVIVGDDYDDNAVRSAANDFFGADVTSPVLGRHFFWKKG